LCWYSTRSLFVAAAVSAWVVCAWLGLLLLLVLLLRIMIIQFDDCFFMWR
jgi:hypothetical protein